MANIVISANTCWYIYNFRLNTIIALIRSGHEVTVVAPEDEYTIKLKDVGVKFCNVYIDSGGLNPLKDFITFLNFIIIYCRGKYDVVLNFTSKNNIYSSLAAKLNGISVVNNISGLGSVFLKNSALSKIIEILYRVSQRKADFVFFQNDDDLNVFTSKNIVDSEKIRKVPGSGVDLRRFSVVTSGGSGVINFLMMCRLIYDKGVGVYVDAARAVRIKYGNKVQFKLLGFFAHDNPSSISRNTIIGWVDEGIVEYLGSSDSVENELGKADCVVLPSFYGEGVPRALLEAAAMGKPIITTNNVGCRETVDDGVSGFLCEPRDVNSLVMALEKIVEMTNCERVNMGLAGRKKIEEQFDEQLVIDRYLDSINSILGT